VNDFITFGAVTPVADHTIELWIKPEKPSFPIVAAHVAGP
jgi:hypothetical protein